MAKQNLECLNCSTKLNKYDAQFVDESTFSFWEKLPKDVQIGVHCHLCFDNLVTPHLSTYTEFMERAKNINIYYLSQSKESRFVRRLEKPLKVINCTDRNEVIMRLAFLAAEIGQNSLVDVNLSSEKIFNGRWQHAIWSGTGIPAHISDASLNRKNID